MSYTVINVRQDGKSYDITQLISSIRWGGDIRETAQNLEIDLVYWDAAYVPRYDVPLGSILILRNDKGKEIIRGVVFAGEKSTSGQYTLTAYDHSIYLLKNRATYVFRSMTADAIARKVCGDFGIPVGNLAAPKVILPKLILRDMTLYDIILIAYTESMKRAGKRYVIRTRGGKLNVIEKAQHKLRWIISSDVNLTDASYSESIEDMRNRVVITNDADEIIAKVDDPALIRQYGLLQHLQQEGDVTSGEARTIAVTLLKQLGRVSREASITCLGIDDMEAGSAVEVKEPLTGLVGTFYVDTDEHEVSESHHTMRLTLSWTDDVLQKEAPEDAWE